LTQTFFAHGKLLLAGEYTVLKGGSALAIPTRYGQSLLLSENKKEELSWQSLNHLDEVWFEAKFDLKLNLISTNSVDKAAYLKKLLSVAFDLSQSQPTAQMLVSKLDFPNNWGLGSSSTLVHLIGQWQKVDPMELFFKTSTGSGYDVACAGQKKPLLYRIHNRSEAQWESVELPKVFNEVCFIHLNKKQQSKPEVERFLKKKTSESEIDRVSQISKELLIIDSPSGLQRLMESHESILSQLLGHTPVKEQLFSDYNGSVKSLGAWGGDFIMALGENTEAYFRSKSYQTIIPFKDMIA
jgi:mevalonate kinase